MTVGFAGPTVTSGGGLLLLKKTETKLDFLSLNSPSAFARRATQPASNTRSPNCSHNGSSASPRTRKILTITTACTAIRCSEP